MNNNQEQERYSDLTQYDQNIREHFAEFHDELLFCIRKQVDPRLIDEFLLSSLRYSNYGFDVERLFEKNEEWKIPYIEGINALKNVRDASKVVDDIVTQHKETYKQSMVFSEYLNTDRDELESGYRSASISIHTALYTLHYRIGTDWQLYYRIEKDGKQFCLNDYQYILLSKELSQKRYNNLQISESGDIISLDKTNTTMSIQKWIY